MNQTDKENEWNEEYRNFMVDFYPKSGPVVSTWQIYLQACRARQSEIDEACKEKKTYIELLDFLSSRNLVVENKELKAELERTNDKIHDLESRLEQSVDMGIVTKLNEELEKANAEIATLKDRLAYEVDMIDGACNEQVQKLMGDLKLAMETIETLNKLKDNVQKERRQAWIELEKARELIIDLVIVAGQFDGYYAEQLREKANEFLNKGKE